MERPYWHSIPHIIPPITVDSTIMTSENIKEFTEISVALCSDGIMSFKMTSVRTSRKSSENAPINPPHIIRNGFPEKDMPKANKTPIPLKIKYFP